MQKNKLSDALSYLLRSENNKSDNVFYANLILTMPLREIKDPIIACVSKDTTTGKIIHCVGSKYDDIANLEDKADVLKHECSHIMYDHFTRFEFSEKTSQLEGMATDLAINELLGVKDSIETLSGESIKPITINNMKAKYGIDLPRRASAEEYYAIIKNNEQIKKSIAQGQDIKTLDEHYGKMSETDSSAFIESVKKALDATKKINSIGTFSNGLETLIQSILNPKVNWRHYFRRFVANSVEVVEERTRKRPDRRYGFIQPGKRNYSKLRVGVPVDTSGSMSDEALAQAWAELKHMSKNNDAEIFVIEADSEVKNVYKFDPNKKPSFTGRGGTAYQPAIDKAMELGVDAIIYIGDMDAADTPKKPNVPVLWAIFGKSNPPGNFGSKVYIE